jgi:hypothetical protein
MAAILNFTSPHFLTVSCPLSVMSWTCRAVNLNVGTAAQPEYQAARYNSEVFKENP